MGDHYAQQQQYAARGFQQGNSTQGQDTKPGQINTSDTNGFEPQHAYGSPTDQTPTPELQQQQQRRQGSGQSADNMGINSQQMMNFGPASAGDRSLDAFQFTPNPSSNSNMMLNSGGMFRNNSAAGAAAAIIAQQQQRNQQMNLNMMNQFMPSNSQFDMAMSPNTGGYSPFFTQNAPINMNMAGQYMPQNITMPPLDFSDPNNMAIFNAAASNYGMMQPQDFPQPLIGDQSNSSNQLSQGNQSDHNNGMPSFSRHTSNTSSMSGGHRGSIPQQQQAQHMTQQQAQQQHLQQQLQHQQQIQMHQHQRLQQYQMQMQQHQQLVHMQQNHQQQQLQRQGTTSSNTRSLNRQNSMRASQQDPASPMKDEGRNVVTAKITTGPATAAEQHQHHKMQNQSQHTEVKDQENQRSDPTRLAEAQKQFATAQRKLEEAQGFPNKMPLRPNMFKNAYSSTGFDMMNVLMRVATRKDPEINIGAVDLSCAFVVCDADEHDCPIVYCSENFERLTGYTKHEILGRNCRFLQAPDGRVHGGIKRSYVDDDSVLYLKEAVNASKEAQVSMINYRKGGQPFMNLLTIIPIMDYGTHVKWFVGFQVDLVEQPNSVIDKNSDGTYAVNYQRGLTMPRYVYQEPERQSQSQDSGLSVPREEVSAVLSNIASGEADLSRRIWDKVLLENTDDVVFVLSLKGLFLYLSPSCKKVLEYRANELMGTALSSVCHPSDIVPVTRELKDSTASVAVDVVFRIRRKKSGYMWFEGNGALHVEQGKGRKSIVLVGRERPVYAIGKKDITESGGINDNELWTKVSTSGMFLFVSGAVRQLLDKTPEELVGITMTSLMRPETKREFLRILELARTGKKASTKHELINKRGQVLQAFSTVFPGDAPEGKKPTFLIVQTRLLKYTKGTTIAAQRAIMPELKRENTGSSMASAPMSSGGRATLNRQDSLVGPGSFVDTPGVAATIAGVHGLELGRQDVALASDENLFDELKTTRSTSWQFELRQMEKQNRLLAEELQTLLAAKKKRKRRKGAGQVEKECANCHTRVTPEWRRGPSGNRDLCNSCGLRFAKQQGRISPRTTTSQRSVHSAGSSDLKRKITATPHDHDRNAFSPDEPNDTTIDGVLAETGVELGNGGHISKSAKTSDITPGIRRFSSGGSLPVQIEEEVDVDDDSAE